MSNIYFDPLTVLVEGIFDYLPHQSGVEVFFIQKSNGKIDVPANPTVVVTVTKDNVQSALIDSGYYPASDFTGLK